MPKSRSFLLGTYYKPPSSSNYHIASFMTRFRDTLEAISSQEEETLLLGDYNLDFLAKRSTQPDCKQMKSLFKALGFTQILNAPTTISHESSTLLDLIATNNTQNISQSGILSCNLGDHELVYCVRKLNGKRFHAQIKMLRNYASYDPVNFCDDL